MMTQQQICRYVDAAADGLGLSQGEQWPSMRAGVISYFTLAAGFAQTVDAVPLTPHDDSPMAFKPVAPKRGAP